MSNHKVALHWLRYHPDQHDFPHIERMQYPSAKSFEWMHNSRDFCANLLAVLPQDAYILARHHPRSEQKQAVWANPEATGRRHADEWMQDVREGRCFLPTDRTFFLPANELDATSGDRAAIDRYTVAYLDRLRQHGLRGGAFNFSTGHPRTVDGTGNTPADYSVFEASRAAIVRGHHIAVLHIYGIAAVPLVPGHFDRLRACPWQDVQWVVGECGIDEHVLGGGSHAGYKANLSGAQYCEWLDKFIMGINDPRIHSYQVFTYDFSAPWGSFNVQEIRADLEQYDWQHAKQPNVLVPGVGTAPQPQILPMPPTTPVQPYTVYIAAVNGLNVRQGPGTDHPIVSAIPYRHAVQVIGKDGAWLRTSAGWIHSSFVSTTQPAELDPAPVIVPPPVSTGNDWPRIYAFILKWEGGWADHPQDTGGATMKGITIGTYTRWREAQGKPQPTKADLRNISDAEVQAIYREWYWKASGADRLAWPMNLVHMDTSVNAGVGKANEMLQRSGGNFLAYMGHLIDWYTRIETFPTFGRAWIRRRAEILLEAAK